MTAPSRLWNRNFVLLWQGQLVSQLGSQAFFVAMAFWVKHETGSATAMGLIMMAAAIPTVVLAPLAGAFVDRHPRKAIIVACDLVSGSLALSLGLFLLVAPPDAELGMVLLVGTALSLSAVAAYFRPAVTAMIPELVPAERLNAGNSLQQGTLQVATLIGLSLGGVLYRLVGAPVLFLIDGMSYLLSAVSEMFIRVPPAATDPVIKSEERGWHATWRDVRGGLVYIWQRPGMRNLMLTAALINFFSAPYLVLLPFFVEDTLAATTDWYGYVVAAFSAGALLGYAAAGSLNLQGSRRSRLMVAALIVMTALFASIGLAPNAPAAAALMLAAGTVNGFFNVNVQTLFQISTPARMRGRVFGLLAMLAQGLMPAAMGLTGVVADLADQNIRLIFVVTGLMTLLLALAISQNRAFRDYLAHQPDAAAEQVTHG